MRRSTCPGRMGTSLPKRHIFEEHFQLPVRKKGSKRTKSTRRRNPTQRSQKKPAHAPKPTPARKRKEQGLCRCGQAAIQGQTRCAECAAKHREWTRQDSENPTKGERHKTPPADRCRINRADPERDRRPKDPRSKPDTQESAQRRVQEEEPTASSASPCGAQITRPLRPMRQTKSCRPDPLSRLRTQAPPDWTAQQSEGQTHR